MGKARDITGQKFGRLTALYVSTPVGIRHRKWHCICDCGNECDVMQDCLISGNTKSCGCFRKENTSNLRKKNARKISYTEYDDCIIGDDGVGHKFAISKEDFNLIKDKQWTFSEGYWITSIKIDNKWRSVRMHCFLFDVPDDKVIDHADGDGCNNRRNNIREATVSQNGMNSKKRCSKSGFTGVGFDKRHNVWTATIMVNKKSIWLGEYKEKEDAVKARLQGEKKYFKEFAPQRHLFKQYRTEVDNEE